MACYFDPALEAEAIPIAADVIRRLRSTLGHDALLFAGAAGPFTMAGRLAQQGLRPEDTDPASFLHRAATEFAEAGANSVFVIEEALPALSPERCREWMESLEPVFNVVRFFGVLPVLLLPDAGSVAANNDVLFGEHWDCVLCPASEGLPSRASDPGALFAIAARRPAPPRARPPSRFRPACFKRPVRLILRCRSRFETCFQNAAPPSSRPPAIFRPRSTRNGWRK